jgi:dipeptidyl aminopeptidase/acylaminoacyl peptidase
MSDERLRRLLTRAGEHGRVESQARAWPVVQEAFRERSTSPSSAPRRYRALAAVAAAAGAALVLALAFTAPGNAVADWLRDQIAGKPGLKRSVPALTHLPGGGRLLVDSPSGIWVVQADGSRRLLGGYEGSTWSPRGLYVAVWRGRELFAVEPGGRVHWSLARGAPIGTARWSPDGYRIAYLAGSSLRVVAGDGTGDKLAARGVAPVAPEWRPHTPHLLAYAPRPRWVALASTDLNGRAWRRRLTERVRALAWSADGRLLAVAGRRGVTLLDGATGAVRRRIPAAAGFHVGAISFAPGGSRLAMALNGSAGRARVVSVDGSRKSSQPRALFAGAGSFSTVAWSPDGRWILIAWPAADQWLFLRSSRVTGVSAVRHIARQFDPRARAPRFPGVASWCCY